MTREETLKIHQIAPSLVRGDAIGNQAMEIWRLLRSWGYVSSIYVEHWHPACASACKDVSRFRGSASDIVIYHYGVGSHMTNFVRQLPDQVVLFYHNITPAHYLHGVNADFERRLEQGREELAGFRHRALAIAASEYNRQELLAMGFRQVAVVPYILDFEGLAASAQSEAGRAARNRYDDGAINILFVGRIVPNKCQEDLVKAFNYYHKVVNSHSRLLLVGSSTSTEAYAMHLQLLVEALGLAEGVCFCGHVNRDEGLGGYYEAASVFVSMSEHEGFCVPLLEAAYFGVPIIAYSAAGVPYTLADSGILVKEKRYSVIGELIDMVTEDSDLKDGIVKGQRRLLERFSRQNSIALLREAIDQAVSLL